MKTIELNRRQFLKTTGGLIVSFNLFPSLPVFGQSTVGPGMDADPTQLDSWLAVAPDGTVTVFSGKVDLGTGVETALAQIVAEELDVPFNRIHMIGLDTSKAINQGTTSGSRTIERGGPQLRQAAAAARQELLKLAAAQLNAPIEKLTVVDGVVSDGAKKISYGQLIGGKKFNVKITATGTGWDMKVAPEVRAKDVKDHKVVGTSQKRIDLPAKLTGEFTYANDVRISGMLHGRVVRPPTITSKPANIDDSSVKNIPGLVKIVQEGSFVGVVCQTEWAAIRAAKALKVSWSQPATKMPAGADEIFAYLKDTKSLNDQVTVNKGNPDSALAQAKKTYEATYRWPFQMHGMMGPPCAVADFAKDQITIHTGTQGSFETRKAVAELLGFPNPTFACSIEKPPAVTAAWAPTMPLKTRPSCHAQWANRCACSGCATTNMVGNPKARRSWISFARVSTATARSSPGTLPIEAFRSLRLQAGACGSWLRAKSA